MRLHPIAPAPRLPALWFTGLAVVAGCGGPSETPGPAAQTTPQEITLESVAQGLDTPWAMAFAPDGRLFVTERPGRIRVIDAGSLRVEPWATVDVVPPDYESEGGLLGIAVAPDFATSRQVFVVATSVAGGRMFDRVLRFTDRDGRGTDQQVIVDDLPAVEAPAGEERAIHTHVGGGLAFGPDGMLYLAMGDVTRPELSQDPQSLAGKILRYRPDGSVPPDNPTPGSPVYASGLRNPIAITWNTEASALFAVDNGPSDLSWEKQYGGGWFGDELDAIVPGGNYGWPLAIGSDDAPGFLGPVAEWSPSVAPAGVAVYLGPHTPWHGNVFATSLRGQRLWRVALDKQADGTWKRLALEALIEGRIGRIRAIAVSPDGDLYISSSNRDRRGQPAAEDDQIYRVRP